MNRSRIIALASLLALFGTMALIPALGVGDSVPTANASSSGTPSWILAGSFLDYQISMNSSVTVNLGSLSQYSGGSQYSFNYTMQGTTKLLVNSILNGNANVSFTPNFTLKYSASYPNGTLYTQTQSETSANATSFLVPLSLFGSNNVFSDSNLSSFGGLSFFSPNLNISLNRTPLGLYNWNGKSLAVIHLDSNITDNQNLSFGKNSGLGVLSLHGTLNGYYTASQDLPLYVGLNLTGSVAIGQVTGNIRSALALSLTNTNIDLGSGQDQEATINVPAYSTTLYVLSNSTIQSSSTAGNQLLLSVSGTSGTQGYVTVVVSRQLLN
ncbi:MAG: hypothetical protein ACREBQ_07605, partial [Nitrososphaerales archaeon]